MKHKTTRMKKYTALCTALLSVAVFAGCAGTPTGSGNTENTTTPPAGNNTAETAQAEQESTAFPAFTATDLDGSTVTESIFAEKT